MLLVMVTWHDAQLFTGTHSREECKKYKICTYDSVGYLISKDEETTIIAGELSDGNYRNVTLIPTGSIVEISDLTFAERDIKGGNKI